MSNTIKTSDFAEEIRYSWACTNCGEFNEEYEEPVAGGEVHCEHCSEQTNIED